MAPNSRWRRGDLVRVRIDPVEGSEQGGERPALVVSPDLINEHSPVVLVIAITSRKTEKVSVRSAHRTARRRAVRALEGHDDAVSRFGQTANSGPVRDDRPRLAGTGRHSPAGCGGAEVAFMTARSIGDKLGPYTISSRITW